MKHAIAILMVVLLAGTAIAEVKAPDTVNATISNPSRIEITGTLDSSSPIWNRAYNNAGTPDPNCNYPMTDSSDGQYFDMICITSTDDNPIEVIVNVDGTTIGDTHMELYCANFDPEDALSNCVFSDDDGGEGLLSAFTLADNLVLPAGTEFWLVITTFSAGAEGDYSISTSANVDFCGGVATEGASWDMIKGMYR